jgi:hypothetical protein
MSRVRVRGIYATALTHRLRAADHAVVQPSDPIDDRFDGEFAAVEADVTVETTGDRQGVGLSGDPDHVEASRRPVTDAGVDTLWWRDDAPRSAVFDGVVERTTGGGAIVALGDGATGYLPFDDADGYVEADDHLRVQVVEPTPPWRDERPRLTTRIQAIGGLVTLVRGVDGLVAAVPSGEAGQALARTTELLADDVPDEWGVRWHRHAVDAPLDAKREAITRAVERTLALEDALAAAPAPSEQPRERVVAPEATVWAWLGRDTRFALDADRRAVSPTMVGHHRVKAGSSAASRAVDFHEGVATPAGDEAFPFGAVTDAFGPGEGDVVAIEHGKPDGRLLTLGRGPVTNRDVEAGRVTVEREMSPGGTYDELDVERERGDVATTRFTEGNWWYPTVYRRDDGAVKGTYVNVSTPVEVFPDAVRYVDLHVDVVKHADGTVEVVDEDELEEAVDAGHVDRELANEALDVAARLEDALAD